MSDGLDVTNYRRNPIVLFSHIDTRPIARATVSRAGNAWYATLQFPDAGVSADADQVLRLAQANILSGISIGFNPLETKPLNGAMRIVRSELLEISVCAVPALQSALSLPSARSAPSTIGARPPAGGSLCGRGVLRCRSWSLPLQPKIAADGSPERYAGS
jgi:HK97 family phage prohead protease